VFLDADRNVLPREAELADRAQLRQERRALCLQELQERSTRLELEKKERETRLVNSAWRERVLLVMTVICFLCALGLTATGLNTGELYAFGGSGTFGVMSSLLLRLLRAG
jgi:hypothetical protein